MKYILFIMLGFSVALVSCKKKGCTDINASNFDGTAKKDDGSCTYEVPPVPIDTICDGLQVDNTFWPLYSGVFRRYETTIYGNPNNVFDISEQVLGQEMVDGNLWYKVRYISYFVPGSPAETFEYFRKDPINGDLYRKDGASEILIMPGLPQLGQAVQEDFFITDLNASVSTGECSYTGCLKAVKTNGPSDQDIIWFKRGVGKVAGSSLLGEDELSEIYD